MEKKLDGQLSRYWHLVDPVTDSVKQRGNQFKIK